MLLPLVLIVSPGLAADNNGNWQTARRWAQMLRGVAPHPHPVALACTG